MSFVPEFDQDVFISYSDIDNKDGWVNNLRARLLQRLAQLLGRRVSIWQDTAGLRADANWSDQVSQNLAQSAVLVVVLTPAYLSSKYYRSELEKFIGLASNSGTGLERIVKAVRTPIEGQEEFEPLKRLLSFEFYGHGESLRSFTDLSITSQEFSLRLDKLAEHIAGILRSLHATSTKQSADRGKEKPETDDRIEENSAEAVAIFRLLSPSSQEALGRADGMRQAMNQSRIHMEHLIAGLLEKANGPTERLLRSVEIDKTTLTEMMKAAVETDLPPKYVQANLISLPPLSKHVSEALRNARAFAQERNDKSIRSRYLLYGALSVERCTVITALRDRGVDKENILKDLPPPSAVSPDVTTPPIDQPSGAYPTPKIASDRWSEHDTLGYQAYARTLAGVITHEETVPPLTIGIKAPWGAGKTSLMKQVQHLLDGDANVTEENEAASRNRKQTGELSIWDIFKNLRAVISLDPLAPKPSNDGQLYGISPRVTVWFNAWKYQTSEQIWAGLAHCIISQVAARMDARKRELFWLKLHARRINKDALRRKLYELLARYLAPVILVLLAICIAIIWALNPFSETLIPILGIKLWWAKLVAPALSLVVLAWKTRDKLGQKAADVFKELVREPDYEGKMGFLYMVESDIRDVLDLVATKKTPLVIFVDDLDRCIPHKVAEVVEAINLSLSGDYPNCIFVLGMEPGMVAAALQVANKEVIETAKQLSLVDSPVPLGWRFMEKIIQLPITIPPPTNEGVKRYMGSLVGSDPSTVLSSALQSQSKVVDEPLNETEVKQWMERFTKSRSVSDVVSTTDRLFAEVAPEKRLAVAEASKRKYSEKFSDRDPVVNKFVMSVSELVGSNPRQLKRYVNVFRFYSTLRHSFRVDFGARCLEVALPSDEALAKFITLSIQWPPAADFLRLSRNIKVAGHDKPVVMSLLGILEEKSRSLNGEDSDADAQWLTFLKDESLMFGEWVATKAFRRFLAEGESLYKLERSGLW
ncbi:MAG TPA: P-loop NTPase fold protein [Candidatus Angelobacter sp.]|nr:P-loop NTPase fold protein [Candidatus Angelobacter sp.]